tara:strand:+ start:163 stop:453 length:291 start_codon:yes stop_codon:yes gene_type:complete
MTVMVMLDFDIKEGKMDEFLGILEQTLPDTRAYNGCLFLKTCVYENQNKIGLVEEWETKKHQEEYFAWRVRAGLTEAIKPYVSDVATTYMDVTQSY